MPEEHFGRYSDETLKTAPPPTEVLQEMFDRRNTEDMATKVFLLQDEARPCCIYLEHVYYIVTSHVHFFLKVSMWFQHLKTVQENRKRGALKAANRRKQ